MRRSKRTLLIQWFPDPDPDLPAVENTGGVFIFMAASELRPRFLFGKELDPRNRYDFLGARF